MENTSIARFAHEVNRRIQELLGEDVSPPWEEASEHIKNSAITGVNRHKALNLTPEQSHESWLEYKINDGWTYGLEKDSEAKTHPCILPYDQLPVEQKLKDFVFKAIVDALK